MRHVSWSFMVWTMFIGLLVFFGVVVAPGCTDQQSKPPGVEVPVDDEGTPEFLAWLKEQKERCASENGILTYDKRFRLATCHVPDVDSGMKIWYTSKWDGITK